jgi:pimeloyl-ACP methyl ester carboxylesterase
MATRIADARLVSIEGAGHGVFVDQPERFNDVLREFLTRLKP